MILKLQFHNTCSKSALGTFFLFLSISGTLCARPETLHCNSHDCKEITKSIAASIDWAVQPCDDFYEHACGHWAKTHPAPYDINIWNVPYILANNVLYQLKDLLDGIKYSSADTLECKAKMAYEVCKDMAEIEKNGIKYLLTVIDDVGGWPMITPHAERIKTAYSWEKEHVSYGRLTAEGGLININVLEDEFNNEKPTFYLDQPTGVFRGLNNMDTAEDEKKYRSFVESIAEAFANERNGAYPDEKILEKDINELLKFRKRLKGIMTWGPERRNKKRMYNVKTIPELQDGNVMINKVYKSVTINWRWFIETTIKNSRNIHIRDEEKIIVKETSYIDSLLTLLEETDEEVIVNHINLFFVEKHLKYTDSKRRLLASIILKDSENSNDADRWKTCILNHPMKHVLSRMYVNKYFTKSMKEDIKDLVSNIQKTAIEEIEKSPWMSKSVKDHAREKLENVDIVYGYPDWYQNEKLMADYYRDQEVSNDYVYNVVCYEKAEYRREIEKFSSLNFRDTMVTFPIDPEIGYVMIRNELEIPAAALQPPLFNAEVPDVIRYATIGHVIAHEFAHALDPRGRTYDELGIKKDWWDQRTLTYYNRVIDCIINKYSSFAIKELQATRPHLRSNGMVTVNEDFSDILGLQVAFQSYKKLQLDRKKHVPPDVPALKGLNEDKIFFYSDAQMYCESIHTDALINLIEKDEHSVHHLRVNGAFSNMPEFSATFGCSAHSFMNSRPKCPIWGK